MLKLRPIIAGIAAISCAACVEIDGVLVFKPDGSAVNRIEVRIASAVVRDLDREAAKAKRNATGTHDEQASFADMCKALAEPSTLPSDAEAKAPRVPTTATVGTRGTWTTCTIVETIADPADYYTRIAEAYGYASPDERFERLGMHFDHLLLITWGE